MEGEKVPRIALFYCSGCMASVGALTVTASLEAFKRLQNENVGLFCLSAIANEVPKHRKTTENAKILVSIDGCGNQCTTNILRAHRFEPNKPAESCERSTPQENWAFQAFRLYPWRV